MNKRSDTYQLASQLLWEDAEPGVKRQIMAYDAHLMLVKVQFQTGAIGSVHQHPHTQGTYVASGIFELTIGNEKKILKAGDGYYVAWCRLTDFNCLNTAFRWDMVSRSCRFLYGLDHRVADKVRILDCPLIREPDGQTQQRVDGRAV